MGTDKKHAFPVAFSGGLDPNRLPHAIVIEGNVEQGLSLAKHISAMALCAEENAPCGQCNACTKTEKDIHPDIFIHVASGAHRAFHIEVIRNVREDAFIKPNEGKRKIYILGNAQSMTDQAQNALLKLLEEPPAYLMIILLLPSASSLLTTVRSRAVCLTLREDEPQPSEQALSAMTALLSDLTGTRELSFMEHFGQWERDKDFFRECMNTLLLLFRDALCQKFGGQAMAPECAGQTDRLGSRLTTAQLRELIELIKSALKSQTQNANYALLLTKLCADLYACAAK